MARVLQREGLEDFSVTPVTLGCYGSMAVRSGGILSGRVELLRIVTTRGAYSLSVAGRSGDDAPRQHTALKNSEKKKEEGVRNIRNSA